MLYRIATSTAPPTCGQPRALQGLGAATRRQLSRRLTPAVPAASDSEHPSPLLEPGTFGGPALLPAGPLSRPTRSPCSRVPCRVEFVCEPEPRHLLRPRARPRLKCSCLFSVFLLHFVGTNIRVRVSASPPSPSPPTASCRAARGCRCCGRLRVLNCLIIRATASSKVASKVLVY